MKYYKLYTKIVRGLNSASCVCLSLTLKLKFLVCSQTRHKHCHQKMEKLQNSRIILK